MAKKFRKVYLVLDGTNAFGENNYIATEIFRLKSSAENVCVAKQNNAMGEAQKVYNVNKPLPQYKVHAFYLVHEDHFEK